ncbi:MAG TPA: hypothetical protein PKH77_09675 [Anaerolineae bacterium]|nr:hypothetical protein [Anaerolineae bacterium]
MRSLSTWIQDVLREYQLTAAMLAQRSALAVQTIYNLQKPAHIPNVTLDTLASLARGLGLHFDTVLAQLFEHPVYCDPLILEIADLCAQLDGEGRTAILRIVRSAVAAVWNEAPEG